MEAIVSEIPPLYLKSEDGEYSMRKYHKFLLSNNTIEEGKSTMMSQETIDELNALGSRLIILQNEIMLSTLVSLPIPLHCKDTKNKFKDASEFRPGPVKINNVYPSNKVNVLESSENITWVGCTSFLCVNKESRKKGVAKYTTKTLEDYGRSMNITDSYYITNPQTAKSSSLKFRSLKFYPTDEMLTDIPLDESARCLFDWKKSGVNCLNYVLKKCNTPKLTSSEGLSHYRNLVKNKQVKFWPELHLWHKWNTSYDFFFVFEKKKYIPDQCIAMFAIYDICTQSSEEDEINTTKNILMSCGEPKSLACGIYKYCSQEKCSLTGYECQDISADFINMIPCQIDNNLMCFDFYFSDVCRFIGRDGLCLPMI